MFCSATAVAEQTTQSFALEELIIYGSKFERSILDTPGSVRVIDKDVIEKANITSLRDVDNFTPNMSINQIGQIGTTSISIRGIQSNPFIVNRTAVYIDGIPFRDPETMSLNNIDQIEVLRGPQSSLYGANADAGVIVVTTQTPPDELAGGIEFGRDFFEGRGTKVVRGSVSGWFTPELSGVFNVDYEKGDSYIKNIASSIGESGEIRDLALNGKLSFYSSPGTRWDVVGIYNDLNAPGLYEQEFPAINRQVYNARYANTSNGGRKVGRFELANDAPKKTEEEEWLLGLGFEHDFGSANLNSVLTYRHKEDHSFGNDLDLTGLSVAAGGTLVKDEYWNFETRLTGSGDVISDWVVGLNYFQHDKNRQLSTLAGPGSFADFVSAPEQRFDAEDVALFGQLVYPLSERVNLTVGLRVEHSERVIEQDEGVLVAGPLVLGFPAATKKVSETVYVPKVSLDYSFDNDFVVYAAAAQGYLPGGFNLAAAATPALAQQFGEYDSEELWSYEVGTKGYLLDGSVFVSSALFYIDAGSWQENRILTDDSGRVLSTNLITSDAELESYGFEIEIDAKFTEKLSVQAGFGYVHSEYKDLPFTSSQNLKGNDVPLIPEFDAAIGATYNFTERLYVRADVNVTGETQLNTENTVRRGIIYLGNVAVGYDTSDWSISAFVENIGNQRYATGYAYSNFLFGNDGTFYSALNTPRIVGVRAKLNF